MNHAISVRVRHDECGAVVLIVVMFIVVLFGFAALSIDVSHVFQEERRAQAATDAAAYAAAALLTNAAEPKTAMIQEALNIASANGITTNEIQASAIGQIEVGRWDLTNQTFTADATPYNSVLVPARRTVPLPFGKVVGFSQMTPTVKSVAMLGGANQVGGLIPFGVTTNQLAGLNYGDIIDVGKSSPGNWQKIDLCGINMSSNPDFNAYMLSGVPCNISVGDTPDSGPGNAGVNNAFDARLAANPIVVLPVVDAFGNGKKPVDIQGFVVGQLLGASGNGSGWNGQILILDQFVGNTTGGPSTAPFAPVRVMVQ